MIHKKLNLDAYQQAISARLENPADSENTSVASMLGVKINDMNWLITLTDLGEVLPVPEISCVPHTQIWFKGMVNVRGNLYALTDLANFFGFLPSVISSESRMLLVHEKYGVNAGLLVDKLVGLRNLSEMQEQESVNSDSTWCLGQYRDANQQLWSVLNIERLLGENRFKQVAAF
jgi:twitching motility protein PilI